MFHFKRPYLSLKGFGTLSHYMDMYRFDIGILFFAHVRILDGWFAADVCTKTAT